MTKVLGAQELSKRVTREAAKIGVAPDRLRKWIASTALLELFNVAYSEGRISNYCVKGGFAVELRNPTLARASQDIDVVVTGDLSDRALLETVVAQTWTLFSFTIKNEERRDHATRLVLQATYNNVPWTTIKLDVVREPIEAIESIDAHDLTVYGLAGTNPVPCLSRSDQIAQYIHAISLPAIDGKRPSRARNIVDIYVFDQYVGCNDNEVLDATVRLFERRATHSFPPQIDIPEAWTAELTAIAIELELDLDGPGLVRFFTVFIARIMGVPASMNHEYQFIVLNADDQAAGNPMRDVFRASPSLEAFDRLTQQEGFRVVTMLDFPGAVTHRAVIVVLEREFKPT